MADTFKRRCGCGQLLALRESCPVCATAARARLHAAGVATSELGEATSPPPGAKRSSYTLWSELDLPDVPVTVPRDALGLEAWLPDTPQRPFSEHVAALRGQEHCKHSEEHWDRWRRHLRLEAWPTSKRSAKML